MNVVDEFVTFTLCTLNSMCLECLAFEAFWLSCKVDLPVLVQPYTETSGKSFTVLRPSRSGLRLPRLVNMNLRGDGPNAPNTSYR